MNTTAKICLTIALLFAQTLILSEKTLADPALDPVSTADATSKDSSNETSKEASNKQLSNKDVSQREISKSARSKDRTVESDVIASIDGRKISASEISQAIDQTTSDRSAILVKRDEKLLLTFIENYINELLILQDKNVKALASRPDVKAKLDYAYRSTLVKAWLSDLLSRSTNKGSLRTLAEESARRGEFNRYKVKHLQFSDRSKAESTLQRIKQNPTLIDKEISSSSEAASAENGGELGWLKKNDLPLELASTLSTLKEGEIYPEVIESKFGFHILKLNKAQILTSDDILKDYAIKQALAERLVAKEREEKLSHYRQKSKIVVFEENLPQVAP